MQVLLAVLTGGMLVAVPLSRFSPAVQALLPVLEAWLQFSLTPTVQALLAVLTGDLLVAVPLAMIFSAVQALLPVLGTWSYSQQLVCYLGSRLVAGLGS